MFSSNLTWNHCIFGNKVHLEYLSLPNNTYVLTKKSVIYVYDAVKCLSLCRGLKDLPTPEKISPCVLKEIFTECDTEENTTEVTIHQLFSCAKVLNFKSLSDNFCTACRSVNNASKRRQANNDRIQEKNDVSCVTEHSSINETLIPFNSKNMTQMIRL